MPSEIEQRAKFDSIRYAQVWEDADLLIEALDVHEGDKVLSIASAGDNSFALLAKNPSKVYAVDLNFSQIACCELRKAMYRNLSWQEHLMFGGVMRGEDPHFGEADRTYIFNERLKQDLPDDVRDYWQNNLSVVEAGFMAQGKFERYFEQFRKKVLPLIHGEKYVQDLIAPKSKDERDFYYEEVWDNRRWRTMFNLFFSRFMMGRLGRDKEFFRFVEGSVADRILSRCKHALTELDPSQNPYLYFIIYGQYDGVYPYALREENYDTITHNLDRIEFKKQPIEEFAANFQGEINAFNLSDIFEYMTQDSMDSLYEIMVKNAAQGARLAYWNMLVPRSCSDVLCNKYGVQTLTEKNELFLKKDKAFFYNKFYLDKVRA
ncbi:MAG: BtaA family protein [Oscillospiraceae bacterium]|nr:BtaA family protein [Oscillospiraceae bacterium]